MVIRPLQGRKHVMPSNHGFRCASPAAILVRSPTGFKRKHFYIAKKESFVDFASFSPLRLVGAVPPWVSCLIGLSSVDQKV